MDDVAYVRQTAESEFSKINLLKIDADEICRKQLKSTKLLYNIPLDEINTILAGFFKKYAVTGVKKEKNGSGYMSRTSLYAWTFCLSVDDCMDGLERRDRAQREEVSCENTLAR